MKLSNKPLPILIGIAHRLIQKKFCQIVDFSGFDLSIDQWMVLMPVWKQDGISQQEISDDCGKDKTSVTRIITTLENKNLLIRIKDTIDTRLNRIHLTNEGKKLFNKIKPLMLETREYIKEGMNDDDIQTTRAVLIHTIERITDENS